MRSAGALALAIGGVSLISLGWTRATDQAAVIRVAREFLEAVRDGDTSSALRNLDAAPAADTLRTSWDADPDVEVRLNGVSVHGDTAKVDAVLTSRGYEIRPRLRLRRGEDGRWLVTGIENLVVDGRWIDEYERQSVSRSDRDLTDALRDRVGDYRRDLIDSKSAGVRSSSPSADR